MCSSLMIAEGILPSPGAILIAALDPSPIAVIGTDLLLTTISDSISLGIMHVWHSCLDWNFLTASSLESSSSLLTAARSFSLISCSP